MMNRKLRRNYHLLNIQLVSILALSLCACTAFVLGKAQEKRASRDSETTLKVNVDLVNVIFTVTEGNGRMVPGLNKEDFLVEEDGRKQDGLFPLLMMVVAKHKEETKYKVRITVMNGQAVRHS